MDFLHAKTSWQSCKAASKPMFHGFVTPTCFQISKVGMEKKRVNKMGNPMVEKPGIVGHQLI